MKVAITATGPAPDSRLDPRFGRCPYLALADTCETTMHFVSNTGAGLGSGAGTRAVQLLIDNDVHVVLTGECGPKATQALAAADIEVITGCAGTVAEVFDQFRSRKLHQL
jgi:predicted Fe-Mo cluster-binding NifX family protein